MTLKLDDGGCCRIHSISDDGNEEIVTNERYVVMPWKMVTRHGTNMTLKEVVEEIKACEEERKLVSKFEAKHRDEMDKILGLIDYIDKWYVEKISLRFTTLAVKGWINTSRIHWLLRIIQPIFQLTKGITNSIISKRPLELIRAAMKMQLNMLKR